VVADRGKRVRERRECGERQSDGTGGPGHHDGSFFDRFAERASDLVSHAGFFIACVALVAVWVPSYFFFPSRDTWQLVINTATTIVTFLLVALLQNSQRRNELGMNEKLDAIAEGLADLMEHVSPDDDGLQGDRRKLRQAVGAERAD
jgi:hypothetical protein